MGDSPDDEALARELHRELNVGPRRRQRRQAAPPNRSNTSQKRILLHPSCLCYFASQNFTLPAHLCVLRQVLGQLARRAEIPQQMMIVMSSLTE